MENIEVAPVQTMNTKSIRFALAPLATAASLALSVTAHAAVTSLTFQPNPVDLYDLDHHDVYAWRIDNINLSNVAVTGATITFSNIQNWDANPNMLFVWMMDTAIHPGVATTEDVDPGESPVNDISDAFLGALPTLLNGNTPKTKLFQKSFTTTPQTYTYNFTPSQLVALQTYINNGHDIAFGFDPDCHFFNDGITLCLNLTPIPEMGTAIPVLFLIMLAATLELIRRRRSAE